MSFYGLQTLDFLERCGKGEEAIPPLLQDMARVLKKMIEEIERPELTDVQKMQGQLLEMVVDAAHLIAACGTEGKLCSQCPFGAYLPTGFPFASPTQPLCLPWIVLTQSPAQVQAESRQS